MGKAAVLAIFGSMAGLLLKKTHPQMAMAVVLAAGAALLLSAIAPLAEVAGAMATLGQSAALPDGAVSLALKLMGVALVAQFGAQTCRDSDQEGLAQKVEFFGRVALLAMCLPVLLQVVELVSGLAAQW